MARRRRASPIRLPEIVVPDDAWADWDAASQTFLTAGEIYTQPETVNMKVVCNYDDNLYDTKWHDGSNFSIGDIVLNMIMSFDVAKEESALYDESQVPTYQSWKDSFRGWRITSEDPLVVEFYTNQYALDAEEAIGNGSTFGDPCAYPNDQSQAYAQGTASWPMMAIGILAEESGEATFGPDKANLLEVDRMSYIGGPTLNILASKLISATEENYIPFAPTMGQYVSEEEATTRWANYSDWYGRKDHLWVGTGPYYLENAFHVEGTAILRHNPDYIDPANKWAGYASPMLAEVEIDGPGQVTIGDEATYDIYITFEGEPYPLASISGVQYLVFDATGALAFSGEAEAVEEGLYQATLSGDQTSGLEAGASKIQAVVVSSAVSIPTFEAFEFVVR